MNVKYRYSSLAASLLVLSFASPSYALKKWQACVAGAGITAATILAIEHVIAPFIANLSSNSAKKQQLAQLAHKQEQVQEIKQRYAQQPFIVTAHSEDLLRAKQTIAQDLAAVHAAHQHYKSSKLPHTEYILKEIEECHNTLQQHDKALDQAIARSISEEAYAHYQEELEHLKSVDGLDADTLERIVVENHIREPYRRHTYLSILDQYIEHCRQFNAPLIVTNSLEVLKKHANRLLGPNIVLEMRDHEEANRRAQEFDVKIAGQRSMKDFYEAAQRDLEQARTHVEESHHQIAQYAGLMQQQCLDNTRAVVNCTTLVQNAAGTLIQANQEQQQLKQHVVQLDATVRDQAAQTRQAVHTEGADIKQLLQRGQDGGNAQQAGAQPNAPSAPPFDA